MKVLYIIVNTLNITSQFEEVLFGHLHKCKEREPFAILQGSPQIQLWDIFTVAELGRYGFARKIRCWKFCSIILYCIQGTFNINSPDFIK